MGLHGAGQAGPAGPTKLWRGAACLCCLPDCSGALLVPWLLTSWSLWFLAAPLRSASALLEPCPACAMEVLFAHPVPVACLCIGSVCPPAWLCGFLPAHFCLCWPVRCLGPCHACAMPLPCPSCACSLPVPCLCSASVPWLGLAHPVPVSCFPSTAEAASCLCCVWAVS